MISSYKEAGVDIEAGDAFASYIRSISSPAIRKNGIVLPGGFAGGFAVDMSKYRHPVILSSTDGIGTKLLIARSLNQYETLGIDLVAMCVNDLIVHGAVPEQFLDYIACARIDRKVLDPVVRGIVKGCEIARCELSGGETAELPDLYEPDAFDLAGFAIGIAEQDSLLPKKHANFANAAIYGLPSSGIHSNGLSLARKIIPEQDLAAMRQLLTPTRIYVDQMMKLVNSDVIIGAAHITGGGLEGNISRLLPRDAKIRLLYNWPEPEIFDKIRTYGQISEEEMRSVFNLGIGMALVVESTRIQDFQSITQDTDIEAFRIGEVVHG